MNGESKDDLADARHSMQDALSRASKAGDLTDMQVDDLYNRFESLHDDIIEMADCDHENVTASIPPNFQRDADSFFGNSMDTGQLEMFRGKCVDCGASIDCSLELVAHRGDDDE